MKLLTTSEAAKILGVTPRRVRVLASTGRLRGAQQVGRDWLIPPASVDNFTPLPAHRPPKKKKK
jgi:excisionase family DNA binding protein